MRYSIAVAAAVLTLTAASPALAQTLRVNTVVEGTDAAPGGGRCLTVYRRRTVKAAVQESNALAGADRVRIPRGTISRNRAISAMAMIRP